MKIPPNHAHRSLYDTVLPLILPIKKNIEAKTMKAMSLICFHYYSLMENMMEHMGWKQMRESLFVESVRQILLLAPKQYPGNSDYIKEVMKLRRLTAYKQRLLPGPQKSLDFGLPLVRRVFEQLLEVPVPMKVMTYPLIISK